MNNTTQQRLKNLGIDQSIIDKILADKTARITSAHAIAAMSQENFTTEFEKYGGTAEQAAQVYTKAKNIKNFVAHSFANVHNHHISTLPKKVQGSNLTNLQELPTYEDLFGSLNYLDVDHDQSILSPSAYLVDILRVVDEYIKVGKDGISLDTRRPDIKNLILNLENTQNTMPFLEYINQHILLKDGVTLESLSTKSFPFAFPINYALQTSRSYIKALDSSFEEIYDLFTPKNLLAWALEVLAITPDQWAIVSKVNTNPASSYDVSDINTLKDISTFAKQSDLSANEIDELFTQGLSGDELFSNAPSFYINKFFEDGGYWQISSQNNTLSIVPSTEAEISADDYTSGFDILQRFIKLAKYMNISFSDLDCLLRAINATNPLSDDNVSLAKLIKIKDNLNLSIQESCALISPINTIGENNLFDKIFVDFDPNNLNASYLASILKVDQNKILNLGIDVTQENLSTIYAQILVSQKLGVDNISYILKMILKQKDDSFNVDSLISLVDLVNWLKTNKLSLANLSICLSKDNFSIKDNQQLLSNISAFFNSFEQSQKQQKNPNDAKFIKAQIADFLGVQPNDIEPAFIFAKSKDVLKVNSLEDMTTTIENLLRYIIISTNLHIDEKIAQAIVDNKNNLFGVIDIDNLSLKNIQDFYQLNSIQIKDKDDLISNLASGNTTQIASFMNWDEATYNNIIKDENLVSKDASLLDKFLKSTSVFNLLNKLGCTLESLSSIYTNLQKTQYSSFEEIEKSLNQLYLAKNEGSDLSNIKQNADETLRDALVQEIKINNSFKDTQAVSEYLLVDTLQSNCSSISAIKEATLAVQTYINRSKLGLENDTTITFPSVWWEWLMSYRVWEVNRKIFLYPENYLHSATRKDKTSIFKDFENNMMQQEVNEEAIKKTFTTYIKDFSKLSNLVITGTFLGKSRPERNVQEVETMFVFGRTNTTPYDYYYQRCFNPYKSTSNWQEWEKIDTPIVADSITITYSFDKLFVFWAEHKERQNGSEGKTQQIFTLKYIYQELDGSWSATQDIFSDRQYNDAKNANGKLKDSYTQVRLINVTTDSDDSEIVLSFGDNSKNITINRELQTKEEELIQLGNLKESTKFNIKNASNKKVIGTVVGNYGIFTNFQNNVPDFPTTFNVFKINNGIPVVDNSTDTPMTKKGVDKMTVSNQKALTLGNYALFAGGEYFVISTEDKNSNYVNDIEVFELKDGIIKQKNFPADKKLVLSAGKTKTSAVSIGNYAIFAGGFGIDKDIAYIYDTVDIFRLVDNEPQFYKTLNLNIATQDLGGTSIGEYVIFAGGSNFAGLPMVSTVNNGSTLPAIATDSVSIFKLRNDGEIIKDENTTLKLSEPKAKVVATTLSEHALFMGKGKNNSSIDIFKIGENGPSYDTTLTLENVNVDFEVATTIGEYAVFAGSQDQNDPLYIFKFENGKLTQCKDFNFTYNTKVSSALVLENFLMVTGQGSTDVNSYMIYGDSSIKVNTSNKELSIQENSIFNFQLHPTTNLSNNSQKSEILFENIDAKKTTIHTMVNTNENFSFSLNNNSYLIFNPEEETTDITLIQNQLLNNNKSTISDDTKFIAKPLSTQSAKYFERSIAKGGVENMLIPANQSLEEFNFDSLNPSDMINKDFISNIMDFKGAYGLYFKEIFFHLPYTIANWLKIQGEYELAQKWYKVIFDPSDENKKYWRYKEFLNLQEKTLPEILNDDASIYEYNNDPFDPYTIANLRGSAFEKRVVMDYIDNLISWADDCFKQESWEKNAEAIILYFTAKDILGDKPKSVGKWQIDQNKSYNDIHKVYGDNIPQFLIDAESLVGGDIAEYSETPFNNIYSYFGVMANSSLLTYWNKVDDRLYKIRNCLNIDGKQIDLSLYGQEIDPNALLQLRNGNTSQALQSLNGDVLPYRFDYLLEKAKSFTSNVIQLGSTLLSALEKQDAEHLSLVRSTHEMANLRLLTTIKKNQIDEAQYTLDGLLDTLESATSRRDHYQNLIDVGSLQSEKMVNILNVAAQIASSTKIPIDGVTGAVETIPNIFGMAVGGSNWGAIGEAVSKNLDTLSSIHQTASTSFSIIASEERRNQEWQFQLDQASKDVEQINTQIEAQKVRLKIAQIDLRTHQESIKQSQEIDDLLKNKFSNKELYAWMVSRISSVYYQSFQIAQDMALNAQKTFQFEMNTKDRYLSFDYWNSLKKGLLAGEGLLLGLSQLEQAYIKGCTRAFEIEKTISVKRLNNLDDSKTLFNAQNICSFSLTEGLFNDDFENHKNRKIKSISITIPAVVGPYENINATLTQTKQSLNGTDYDFRKNQSIAISKGVNDAGLFELNFADSRYLPFEGTGAVSDWELKLNGNSSSLKDSISDVIVNLKYTAIPSQN